MSYIQELRALVGHRPLILVGAAVLVFDKQRRLLLQRRTDDHLWECPGGFMEPGETTEDTARREVREETGLEIGEMKLFQVLAGKEFYYECPNGDQVYSVLHVCVSHDVGGHLQADGNESSEARYFPVDELPDKMHPIWKKIVENFLKSQST